MTSETARDMGRSCLFFRVRRAARVVGRRYDAALRPIGISANQLTVLAILQAVGPMTIGDLADAAWVDMTTMSRTVHRLHRDRLIALRPGRDRRTRHVTISETGRARLERAYAIWQELQSELQSHVPEGLVRSLRALERASGSH